MAKKRKKIETAEEMYEDCDDDFAYIAGFTEGGFPYGLSWEEVGIDPDSPFDEKVRLFSDRSNDKGNVSIEADDLPF